MRVLVTGAGGQLGRDLVSAFESSPASHEVVAADHLTLDVCDRDAVLGTICATRPDAVVHAAAWTSVDACESDPGRALATNALGSRNVADAANRIGASLCYLSTDYVFDGTKTSPYDEWDEPKPLSVYGRSKLGGEHEVLGRCDISTVVRTSWVCGDHGSNIVKVILRLAEGGGALRFVDDQWGHPSFCGDLAPAIMSLVVERRPGVFHLTNSGQVSWYQFAREVMQAAGHDPDRVLPVSTADLDPPRPARRPANSVLENLAWRASGHPPMRDFREPLHELVGRLTG